MPQFQIRDAYSGEQLNVQINEAKEIVQINGHSVVRMRAIEERDQIVFGAEDDGLVTVHRLYHLDAKDVERAIKEL